LSPPALLRHSLPRRRPRLFRSCSLSASTQSSLASFASLNRPGGNITGVSLLNAELAGKQLDLLHELLPTATAVALLVNPSNPFNAELETTSLRDAARALGLQAHVLRASTPNEIDAAFRALVDLGAAALVVSGDAFFYKPTRADRRASGKNHSLDSPRGECAMLGSWLRLYV